MFVDSILNSDNFNKLFNINFRAYNNFYKMNKNGLNVMDELREIYSVNDYIENKMKFGYEYVSRVFDNRKIKE